METLPARILPSLTRAAELRASGSSWAKVAQELGRSAETCRHWPRRYPATWRRLYRQAAAEGAAEGGAEAHVRLRMLIRHDDPRISLRAAALLQRAWEEQMRREDRDDRPEPGPVAADVAEFARYLKGLTDDQLAKLLADFLARRPAAAAGPAAGTGDPPGPGVPE